MLPSTRTWSWRSRLQLMFPMQDSCPPVTPLCSLPIRRPQVEKAAKTGGTTKAVQSHFERKASRQQTSRSHHTKVVYFIFKSAITGKKSQILKGKPKPNTGFCTKPSTGRSREREYLLLQTHCIFPHPE